jgi:hypothetical protein
MKGRNWGLAVLCSLILIVFAYCLWIGAQKSPAEGGPQSITN